MSKKTYILIDNDSLIHKLWIMAAKKSAIELFCFHCVEEFLNTQESFNKNIDIYLDSQLDNDQKGEIEAEKIYNLGFHSIYLATGLVDLDIENYPWIKSIVSKRPPF